MRRAVASKAPAWTLADVAYDPATHTSTLPDGRSVPHVTAILEAVGVTTNFGELASFGPRMADAIALAAQRGTAVHADCHALDDDDLAWETVDPRIRPYVEAWAQCKWDKGLVPVAHARERRVFEPTWFYAGILDGIFMCGKKRILADIATGDPESSAKHLQTAAYCQAWELEHPDQLVDERWGIWLRPGRAVPYKIISYAKYSNFDDFRKFSCCVVTFNEQPARRARA